MKSNIIGRIPNGAKYIHFTAINETEGAIYATIDTKPVTEYSVKHTICNLSNYYAADTYMILPEIYNNHARYLSYDFKIVTWDGKSYKDLQLRQLLDPNKGNKKVNKYGYLFGEDEPKKIILTSTPHSKSDIFNTLFQEN